MWRKRPVGRFAFLVFLMPQNYQAAPIAPSGGRTESLWRGLSDMDVARAVMGQGRPFAAGPRSNDGVREPQRSWGRMSGLDLLVSFGAMPKETRSTERNRTYPQRDNAGKPQVTHSAWNVKSSRLKPLLRITRTTASALHRPIEALAGALPRRSARSVTLPPAKSGTALPSRIDSPSRELDATL